MSNHRNSYRTDDTVEKRDLYFNNSVMFFSNEKVCAY
jgi:hypothetical protein